MNVTLAGTTIPGQCQPGSNSNKAPEHEPHHQMKFSVISRSIKIKS